MSKDNEHSSSSINAIEDKPKAQVKKSIRIQNESISYNEKAAAIANDSLLHPCEVCQRTVMFG
jgi:hypothetical protein